MGKSLQWHSICSIFYAKDTVKNFFETLSEINVPSQNLNRGQAAGGLCLLLNLLLGKFILCNCIVHPQPGFSYVALSR